MCGLNAEEREKVGRDPYADDLFRPLRSRQRCGHRVEDREIGEAPILTSPVFDIPQRRSALAKILRRVLGPEHHQPVWVVIRDWPEQHGIQDTEHRGVGANRQRQGADRGDQEGSTLQERSNGEADVLEDDVHRCDEEAEVKVTQLKKLELIREAKLFRLIPGRTKDSRLEASGVALIDDTTAFVVFDNLNQIARIDVSLKRSKRNGLWRAPSLGAGFEDIATDRARGATFGLIEAVEDFDGMLRGFVSEYNHERQLRDCTPLPGQFRKDNKGFEGLAHVRHKGREHLYALREANSSTSAGCRGRIDVFVRDGNDGWKASRRISLPGEAWFKDYSALACRDNRIAIVSQESARLWVARLDPRTQKLIRGSGTVYRFPGKNYLNVEGIDWLSADTLIAVSDRMKKDQPARAGRTDQSIHVFRIPG